MARKKTERTGLRIAYAISLDDNDYYEANARGELLLFDNYEQVADYANANDINFERISVRPFEVEELSFDVSDIPEVEF